MRAAVAALSLIALAGCTLVDQRTFRAEGAAPGAEEVARAGAAALPLVSVRMEDPAWQSRVAAAVQAAQQRAPGTGFDVMALVPRQAAPAEQDRRVAEAARDARAVGETIGAAGVSPERVGLGLLGDLGSPAREVRVFRR